MAIQAISSVRNNNGYSNISFEGKKDKSDKSPKVSSPMKAVPLAVLLAMSPMTTTNAEAIMRSEKTQNVTEVVQNDDKKYIFKSKEFVLNNDSSKTGMVGVIQEPGEEKPTLYFVYQDKSKNEKELMIIDGFDVIDADIVSSNGVHGVSITFALLNMRTFLNLDERTLGNQEVIQLVNDLNVQYKTATGERLVPAIGKSVTYPVLSRTYNGAGSIDFFNLIPTYFGKELMAFVSSEIDLGTKVKTIAKDFEGTNDKYTVNLRKNKDGEYFISVSSENIPELPLKRYFEQMDELKSDYDHITSFLTQRIILGEMKADEPREFVIIDYKLFNLLQQLKESSEYSKYIPEQTWSQFGESIVPYNGKLLLFGKEM